jgi:hypothetical protein
MKDDYPCHKLPRVQWCDRDGPGGFMGHTCIERTPQHKEKNFIGDCRVEISDLGIAKCIALVEGKISMRLKQKHRGSYIGNHETYGIVAEEFDELLDALRANDNQEFFAELMDIAVGCIIGMASMYANKLKTKAQV